MKRYNNLADKCTSGDNRAPTAVAELRMTVTPSRDRTRRYADNIDRKNFFSCNDQTSPVRATSATSQLSSDMKTPREIHLRRHTSTTAVGVPNGAARTFLASPRSCWSRIPVRRRDHHEGGSGVRGNFCGLSPRSQPSSCSLQRTGSASSKLPKPTVGEQQRRRQASAANSSTGLRDNAPMLPSGVDREVDRQLRAITGHCPATPAIDTPLSTPRNDRMANARCTGSLTESPRSATESQTAERHASRGNRMPNSTSFGDALPVASTGLPPIDITRDDRTEIVRSFAPGHVRRMAAQLKIDPACLRPPEKISTTAGCLAYARNDRSKCGNARAPLTAPTSSLARGTRHSDSVAGSGHELVKSNVAPGGGLADSSRKNIVRQTEDKSSISNEMATRETRIDKTPESGVAVRAQGTTTSGRTSTTTASRANTGKRNVEGKVSFAKPNATILSPRSVCNTPSQPFRSSPPNKSAKEQSGKPHAGEMTTIHEEHKVGVGKNISKRIYFKLKAMS